LTKGATDGVVFDYANLTGPTTTAGTQMNFLDKNALNVTDGCGVERVAYLRGDAGHEGTSGSFSCVSPSTSTISKFRPRNTSKLGDIVSSNPWYVGVPAAGYSDVTHPGYSSFLTSKLNRTPMVYVGSNDGMLHGFDASLTINTANPAGIPTSTSGTELLAYIPTAVFQNLSKLTDQSYKVNHLYFVDSSPMTADADLGTSTTHDWRTVLVGALGAGGKGYYALDISDPATFSQSTSPTNAPANTLLWEFDEADMGYVYNLPPESSATKQAKQIVKMANGKWAAILGNGYNSISGKAVLYIVFINDGVDGTWAVGDTVKITADVPAGLDNGLSTPIPVDTNNDGYADTVYAGDIKGNLWKFLVGPNSSDATVTTTTSTWKLAFLTTANAGCPSTTVSCTPLFKPTDSGGLAQPIVSPPEIGAHPLGGQLVFFGTGKYIEASDNTNTSVQTFYGIWDKQDGSTTVGTRAVDLLQQTLSTTACASPAVAGVACTLTTAAGGFRIPTTNAITWRTTSPFCAANGTGTCPLPVTPTHMGWYIDLPSSKERVTGMPQLINKVVFFNTIIPSTAVCDAGGTGWLMSLDYLTGGLTGHQVFDTTGNGIIDSSDTKVAGFQVGAALGGTTLIQNQIASSNVGVGVSALTNSSLVSNLINFGTSPFSRLSWRELVQ
jgi:type IV pilus assembly protein PilY1